MSYALDPSRIRLRPRHKVIDVSRGRTMLGMNQDGAVEPGDAGQGLYVYQTRVLSKYCWTLEGKQLDLSAQSAVEQHSWLAYFYDAPPNCKDTPTGECNPLQQTIEVKISRVVGEGMHEDVEVTNHTQIETVVTLALAADADFAARQEIPDKRKQKGALTRHWKKVGENEWTWTMRYRCEHAYDQQGNKGIARLDRAIQLRLRSDSEAHHSGKRISFSVHLSPHQTWKACLMWQAEVDGHLLPVEPDCNALTRSQGEYFRKREVFLQESTAVRIPASRNLAADVRRVLDRSRLDIAALRLYDVDEGEHNWKLAAGVPTYMALFGRDMLVAGWQASLLSNDMGWGALSLLASMQCHDTNDWRDAQPGRILHESHTDPLSVLNFSPEGRYFGTANAPFLYPMVVSEVWRWTGQKDHLRRFAQTALDALAWADKNILDPISGFYKYQTRSKQGLKNQGWKDSSDAIVYPDGSQVEDPLGTCEMQAFAYAAKLQFAEFLWCIEEAHDALRLYREAEELKKRFNERFWMEDQGYVAMAIDKDNHMVNTIASDAGHCVFFGILEGDRPKQVIDRMMQPDMFSGWGIRTLSSSHPAYNPFAYHRGTVWPAENGSFVLGMARYGLREQMWHLSRALFETAGMFDYDRLPEVFGGHTRDHAHPFPCLYEKADSPQAWSASVPFIVMQSLLGICPNAPLNTLFLDPWLPDWMPEVSLENLAVGDAKVSLHFRWNGEGKTDYTVDRLDGDLHIVRQSSSWSVTADWGQRVKDAAAGFLNTR